VGAPAAAVGCGLHLLSTACTLAYHPHQSHINQPEAALPLSETPATASALAIPLALFLPSASLPCNGLNSAPTLQPHCDHLPDHSPICTAQMHDVHRTLCHDAIRQGRGVCGDCGRLVSAGRLRVRVLVRVLSPHSATPACYQKAGRVGRLVGVHVKREGSARHPPPQQDAVRKAQVGERVGGTGVGWSQRCVALQCVPVT